MERRAAIIQRQEKSGFLGSDYAHGADEAQERSSLNHSWTR